MATQFEYLYTPLKIGPVTVRNRIVSSPHATCLADADGMVTERQIDYHAERARGGVGLIILGTGYVHPTGKVLPGMNTLYDERVIPGLRRLAEAVHRHGAVLFGQQYHVGGQFRSDFTELPLWAPSTLPHPVSPEIPHEMEPEEIEELIEYEARGARHYREAGFDGVEICMCHGRLLGQFLSPFSNRRTDEYGGSLEGRLRIACEVIDRVREAVGEDRVVGVRISGDEFTDGGLTLKEMQEIAPRLEAPDAVIVATGSLPSWPALPGLDRERVFLVEDVLLRRAKVGKRVLVVVFTPMRVLKGMTGEMVRTMDVYSREEIEIEGVDTVGPLPWPGGVR